MRRFKATLTKTVAYIAEVEVQAENANEANDKAYSQGYELYDRDWEPVDEEITVDKLEEQ